MAAHTPQIVFAHRPLHFIWVLDCSGSMEGTKIQSLNFAIQECIPAMREAALENHQAKLMVRCVTFADTARWHVEVPTPVADFEWRPVAAGGQTYMGEAMRLLADGLTDQAMGERGLTPVIVLVTDGHPTDSFTKGFDKLMARPWGKKALRLAIAIGDDADTAVLRQFIANPELSPLRADNAPTLAAYMRWVSTVVVRNVSQPVSMVAAKGVLAVGAVIGPAPAPVASVNVNEAF